MKMLENENGLSSSERRFLLYRYLLEHTNREHVATPKAIRDYLDDLGIKTSINTLYNDLRILSEEKTFNLQWEYDQSKKGYRVVNPPFEPREIRLLIDSIQASKFLSESKSDSLIKKLEKLCSKYEKQSLHRSVVLANRVKNTNTKMFYSVDAIHQAISANKQIQFKYFDYDVRKERKYFKKGEFYIASPFAMIYADDNYYLLAYEGGKFKHFRVDKMDSVKMLDLIDREGGEEFAKVDMAAYTKYTFNMFGGEIEHVTMVFQNRFVGTVMDRFGRDVLIMKEDDRHFRITVSVAVSNQFFGWIFGLGKGVRIVGPERVKEKMRAALAEISARYED